jgi:hypothetical protein
MQLVETAKWKLLRDGEKVQLFRPHDDPAELHDVAANEPAVVEALVEAGTAKLSALGIPPHELENVSSETVERMRALGYLQK